MSRPLSLIQRLADQESRLTDTTFFAPCIAGGMVRARISGMIYTFVPEPEDFSGWGIFQPLNSRSARLVEEGSEQQIDAYQQLFPRFRLRLALALRGGSWLAYPANESDAVQRLGRGEAYPVHLVRSGAPMAAIVARWDGSAFWFEDMDRRADPIIEEKLRGGLREKIPVNALRISGLTPEDKTSYEIALYGAIACERRRVRGNDRDRLEWALRRGGGRLHDFTDNGDYWTVEWLTGNGERHRSAVSKRDLTVYGAGICLSGQDRNFDLQSLVAIVESRPDWMR